MSFAARVTAVAGFWACLALGAPAPAAAAGLYFVQAGDTLSAISRLFDVTVDRIIELNRLESPAIAPGDRLRIPDPQTKPRPVAEDAAPRAVDAGRVHQAVCREENVYHSVTKGDTLSAIASRYATDVASLARLNGLRQKHRLAIGQKILVRRSGPRSHTVVRGETLTRIARHYGIDVDEIARLNRLDRHKITAGQQLLIEPCDPIAAAGSEPPPLGVQDASRVAGGALGLAGTGSAAPLTEQVIAIARSMLNVPYRFGGNSLRGIDCSAYVQRVFGHLAVSLPRTARGQYEVGARVDRDDLQVGDLVFFRTYASFPSHVGIYLGDNRFIHASSMVRRVAIDSIDRSYYRKRFIGGRRLVVDSAPAVASTP